MRLMRLTTNYPGYLQRFYGERPELADLPYDEHYRVLALDSFGWADFWTHALHPLGYEVWEPIANNERLQRAWARENGIADDCPLLEISAHQVRSFKPDSVLIDDPDFFDHDFIRYLRETCPSLRIVVGWCGSPFEQTKVFAAYDVVLSNMPHFVQRFQQMGLRSEYMYHAFGLQVLDRLPDTNGTSTPFCFIGSIVKAKNFHNEREVLLKHLVEQTDLQICSESLRPTKSQRAGELLVSAVSKSVRAGHKVPGVSALIDQFPRTRRIAQSGHNGGRWLDSWLAARLSPPLYGLAMYQQMRHSAVVLNNHIDVAGDWASNMRLFEATGVGTCLLTDWKSNLAEIFEPDVEVAVYRTPNEAVEKYRWLMENDSERRKIAAAGQARTLRDHTLAQRAVVLNQIIRETLAN